MNNDVCVSLMGQGGGSVESEVFVWTGAPRLLDAQLHYICTGLEQMGGNLGIENVKDCFCNIKAV